MSTEPTPTVVRHVFIADLNLELRLFGTHPRGSTVSIVAVWTGGDLAELDDAEREQAEQGRRRAALRFTRDLGLILGELQP